ncbi:MAG: hypothetical protein M1820_003411 [Bogoriella megaspora]|nr:MAG: hypothetical protein M1820_003411 [Bogoriella megaspora]
MTAPSLKRVAVAGPNGTLGPAVIKHLSNNNLEITLLTRDPKKASETHPPPTKVVQADYDSVEQLTSVLRQGTFDSLVILINRDQLGPQLRLIDAAIAARTPHIIPSSFGIDHSHPKVREAPFLKEKIAMEDYLFQKADQGQITYTSINGGWFFDWALSAGILINSERPNPIYDGGDVVWSTSTTDLLGQAVAQAVLKRDELSNRVLFVQSAAVNQNQLFRYAKELAPHKEFKTIPVDTAALEKQSWERWNSGDRSLETMRGFLPRISLGLGLGLFKNPDNELLGLKQMREDEIKALIAQYVQ